MTPDDTKKYVQTARSGSSAPHAWLPDGRSALDLFGRGFVRVRLGAAPPDVSALMDAAVQCGMPLRVFDITDEPIALLYERKLVPLRSDGHSAWRANAVPADSLGPINRLCGA